MDPGEESKELETSESSHAKAASIQSENNQTKGQQSSGNPWFGTRRFIELLWEGSKPTYSDERFNGIKYEEIDQYAKGYPRLAAFHNSDPDFRVFRRFGTLRNRLILRKQYELVVLEKELFDLDSADSKTNAYKIQSMRRDKSDQPSKRDELLDTIESKLREYDGLLELERNSMSLKKPRARAYRSIINYYWNERPVVKSETDFLNLADDFVILSGDKDTAFHSALERFIVKSRLNWLKQCFSTPETLKKTKDPAIRLLDKTRVNYLAIFIAAVASVIILMMPVCLLFRLVVSDQLRLAIVLLSAFLFHTLISFLAKPNNYESFMATAAYCAVLVAFLSNLTNSSSGLSPKG